MVTVQVPATSANLGPGFDLLGLALPLYNRLTFREADTLSIRHTGGEATGLPEDASHLAHRAAAMLCETIGAPVPAWALKMDVQIPQSRASAAPARRSSPASSAPTPGMAARWTARPC